MATMLTDAVAQLEWLVKNSDGIVGLRADGGVMPWSEVLKLYAPDLTRLIDGYAERYEAAVERGKERHKQMLADLEPEHSDGLDAVVERLASYTDEERERDLDAFAEAEGKYGSDREQFDGRADA